jgi:hypothetical protein
MSGLTPMIFSTRVRLWASSAISPAFLGARIRVYSADDQFDHRNALADGKSADTPMELGRDLEIELAALGAGAGDQEPVSGG